MELLVMRHGSAEDSRDDFGRRLTTRGIEEVHLAAKSISQHEFDPDIIFASPFIRAQQTAEIVAIHLATDVVECDRIVPSGDCEKVCDLLDQLRYSKDVSSKDGLSKDSVPKVLIVSHQPFVSLFIQYLTGEQIFMNTASLSMIRVESFHPGCGTLLWTE